MTCSWNTKQKQLQKKKLKQLPPKKEAMYKERGGYIKRPKSLYGENIYFLGSYHTLGSFFALTAYIGVTVKSIKKIPQD